jgi:hypothetical protein
VRHALGEIPASDPSQIAPPTPNQRLEAARERTATGKRSRKVTLRKMPHNSTRGAILENLTNHPELRPHPDRPRGTKYISIFMAPNGRAVALDKTSASRQAIWVQALGIEPNDLSSIRREAYPASRGRNSNLNVAEFRNQDLLRFYPETTCEAEAILALVIRS